MATLPGIALRQADTKRATRAYWAGAILCAVGAVSLRIVEGPRALGWSTSAAVLLAGIGCAVVAYRHRDGRPFTDFEATTVGSMLCIAALAACAHIGPFSVAVAGLVILVLALAMGDDKRGRVFGIFLATGYVALASFSVLGTLPPVSPTANSGSHLILGLSTAAVVGVIGVSYWLGRVTRRATASALASLLKARIAIAGRDALLNEVRADLDRLRAGRHGRLTGQQLDAYRLHELIGRGGNGEVYRGKSAELGDVAVKVLHPNLISEDTQVDRFFREARVASSLASEHIVGVHELGMGPEGAPFIIMELLEGVPLNDLLRNDGPMALEDVVLLVSHVARGLAIAHDAGVVHRDVKPGNLVRVEGRDGPMWKVVDFGISKLMEGSGTLTRGDLIGTPGYMAPEQAAALDLDHRADVFGLGAVAYRALTGRPPFTGRDPIAVALQSLEQQPLRPGAMRKLPRDVDLCLALALTKEPGDRFPTVSSFANAFELACRDELDDVTRSLAREYLALWPWREELDLALPTRQLSAGRP